MFVARSMITYCLVLYISLRASMPLEDTSVNIVSVYHYKNTSNYKNTTQVSCIRKYVEFAYKINSPNGWELCRAVKNG